MIALPWFGDGVFDFINATHELLADKTVIDVTNVLNADYSPLRFEDANSGAEKIQAMVPAAKVVKAFNTASGHSIAKLKLKIGNATATGFYCGNDSGAKQAAAELLANAGFDPLDVGGLKNARYLEGCLAHFAIALGLEQNLGFDRGWVYLQQ
jgi:predicted dinucleotide-binding enzyme